MTSRVPPVAIGPFAVDTPVVLAPMAGITNVAYRQVCREFGSPTARYLCAGTDLGETYHATREYKSARNAWQQALAILEQLGHPDAEPIRAKLSKYPTTTSTSHNMNSSA